MSAESNERPRGKGRRILRVALLYVLLPLILLLVGCRIFCSVMVDREERNTPRDPATGVILGLEERTLGPEDSRGLVLMVHGFVGGSNNFSDLPDRLAALGWRVRVMRLPGHGTSPRDFARQDPDDLIQAVRDELALWGEKHDTVVLVGHSMGGALSTLIASEEGVDNLVLGAPYFGVTHRWWYGLRPETWTRILRPVLPWLYKGKLFIQVNRPEAREEIVTYDWIPVRGLVTLHRIGARVRDPEVLARVLCPVLLVHSRADAAASPEAAEAALEAMGSRRKEALWLTRSNHHVFWDWERDEVMAAIEEFVGPAPGSAQARDSGDPSVQGRMPREPSRRSESEHDPRR